MFGPDISEFGEEQVYVAGREEKWAAQSAGRVLGTGVEGKQLRLSEEEKLSRALNDVFRQLNYSAEDQTRFIELVRRVPDHVYLNLRILVWAVDYYTQHKGDRGAEHSAFDRFLGAQGIDRTSSDVLDLLRYIRHVFDEFEA